jgi:hypothetical protein
MSRGRLVGSVRCGRSFGPTQGSLNVGVCEKAMLHRVSIAVGMKAARGGPVMVFWGVFLAMKDRRSRDGQCG